VSNAPRSKAVAATGSGERVERLFVSRPGSASKIQLAAGMLGCAALGAGFYGAFLAPHPVSAAWPLLALGIVVAATALLLGPRQAPSVRVGELGIIVGDPAEARRLYWYELEAIGIADEALAIESSQGPIRLPLAAHAAAAARIIAEASQRLPSRVDISPKAHERLPRLEDAAGQTVPAARLQLAGQKCAASGVTITFETDARLCENCAALYHKAHVPAVCSRCERALAEPEALAAG
jgi:hypothetical protein